VGKEKGRWGRGVRREGGQKITAEKRIKKNKKGESKEKIKEGRRRNTV